MENLKGHLVLLMAPSGGGKGTVMQGLGDLRDELYFAKTFTSRSRREGAQENPKYTFVSRDEFEQMIREDAFVEWADFSGNYYGTPKSEVLETLTEPVVVFKEMELQGVEQIKKLLPADRVTTIYIDAGTWEELQERVLARAAIDPAELELRRLRFVEEEKFKTVADVLISNKNGEMEQAQAQFKEVITRIVSAVKK